MKQTELSKTGDPDDNSATEPVAAVTDATTETPAEEAAEATEATTETVAAEEAEPSAEATTEEPAEPTAETAAEETPVVADVPAVPAAEDTAEAVADDAAEPTTEPTTEEPTEPVADASAEPVTETPSEPVAETPAEPVAETPADRGGFFARFRHGLGRGFRNRLSGGFGGLDVVRDQLRRNMRQYGMILALTAIIVVFQIWTDGILLKPLNVTNLVQQNSYILILAIGMVMVIIAGHIDLSVGSLAGFVGAAASVLMVNHNVSWPIAVVLALLVGAVVGAWQGFWIAYVGIPSFIVTLAGMLVFRGGTQVLLQGESLAPFPAGFQKISSGFLPEVGPDTNYHNLTLLLGLAAVALIVWQEFRNRRIETKYGFEVLPLTWFIAKVGLLCAALIVFTMLLASYQGVPVVLLILAGLLIAFGFLMRATVLGRHIYAIGGNNAAARLSGIKTQRVTFLVFVNMGVLSALAGLVFAARLNAGTPQAGLNFELEAIAAAFIGGASATGGVGTVFGAIIGGLVLGVLNNGMSLVGIGTDWQQVIKGLVLLAAVGFDVYNKRRVGS